MKLMRLDEVARRSQNDDKELYSMVLQRFLCHKSHPKIGFLVSSMLSSPIEARLLEKEQKFLKLHGQSQSAASTTDNPHTSDAKLKRDSLSYLQAILNLPASLGNPRFIPPPTATYPSRYTGPPPSQQQTRPRQRVIRCYYCGEQHYKVDCPQLK